jgi:putative endonuclease
MIRKSEVGKLGENFACQYLKSKKYKIIERNYRQKYGELDIVALSPEKTLVFVEVKTVTGPEPAISPEEQITKTKLDKLQRIAQIYANGPGKDFSAKMGWRIDLVAITQNRGEALIKHYKNI